FDGAGRGPRPSRTAQLVRACRRRVCARNPQAQARIVSGVVELELRQGDRGVSAERRERRQAGKPSLANRSSYVVIPAQAGIQNEFSLDPRLRGGDERMTQEIAYAAPSKRSVLLIPRWKARYSARVIGAL